MNIDDNIGAAKSGPGERPRQTRPVGDDCNYRHGDARHEQRGAGERTAAVYLERARQTLADGRLAGLPNLLQGGHHG